MLGCFGDKRVTRDSIKGKVYEICWENKLSLQRAIPVIQIDTNQPPNEKTVSKKTKCIGFLFEI